MTSYVFIMIPLQRSISALFVVSLIILGIMPGIVHAQIQEPDLERVQVEDVRTHFDEGIRSGIGFNVVINNYGFGIGGEYKRILSPTLEGAVSLRWTGLRDVSEQTYTDIFFGQQVIPNKYQRAYAFPLTFSLRKRIFSEEISDNYRFYVSGGLGPVVSFSHPYFDDRNNNGYREQFQNNFEETYDVFTGISEGKWHLGMTGELKVSVDIGENFSRLTSVKFGYMFYHFPDGIQLMQPNQPVRKQNPEPGEFPFEQYPEGHEREFQLVMQDHFDPIQFFGTPQISLVFGKMW